MKKFSLMVVAIAALCGTLAITTASASPVFNWSGFYAGVQGGHADGDALVDFNLGGTPVPIDTIRGGFGGLYVGYNWQTSAHLVIGIESDINLSSISGSEESGALNNFIVDVKNFGSIRGRVGIALDRALFFVTGGLAWAGIEHTQDNVGVPGVDKKFHTGWTAGLGLEYAFTPHILGRIEYRRYDFSTGGEYVLGGFFTNRNVSPAFDTISLGVAYRW